MPLTAGMTSCIGPACPSTAQAPRSTSRGMPRAHPSPGTPSRTRSGHDGGEVRPKLPGSALMMKLTSPCLQSVTSSGGAASVEAHPLEEGTEGLWIGRRIRRTRTRRCRSGSPKDQAWHAPGELIMGGHCREEERPFGTKRALERRFKHTLLVQPGTGQTCQPHARPHRPQDPRPAAGRAAHQR